MVEWWESLSGSPLVATGILVIVTALLLRRSVVRSQNRRGSSQNHVREIHQDFRRNELSLHSEVLKLEVRLHEHTREIEARLSTKMAVLDRLIVEADREIARLNLSLENSRKQRAASELPVEKSPRPGVDPPHRSAA